MALVVKVKYEGMLRRFNVYQREDGSMDISLDALISKICKLFNFNPNTRFIITYVDGDNDVVTMADEDDLFDALGQGLNPLRLELQLVGQNLKGVEIQSQSGSSTPRTPLTLKEQGQTSDMRGTSLEEPLKPMPESLKTPKEQGQTFGPRSIFLEETLKLIPEPFQRAFMNCTQDPFVRAVASTPAVSEFLECLMRIARTQFGPLTEALGTNTGTQANNSMLPTGSEEVNPLNQKFQPVAQDLPGPSAPSVSGEVRRTHNFQLASQDFIRTSVPWVSGKACGKGLKRNWAFHKGVQCDGCGIQPIVGPRYKSRVKEDYDLCHSCFSEMGNDSEYKRLDQPVYMPPHCSREIPTHRGRLFHKLPHSFSFRQSAYTPCPQRFSEGKLSNQPMGKLDCRFVQDVTIFDGTQLAPGTPFTKIWRLRNNGTLPWPALTQLVRVGGDELGARNEVNLEIQEEGCPVNAEVDAAIDFIAPMQPGRYVSYWRLMAPSGQKFGQRVWVLIQVETAHEEALPNLMEFQLSLEDVNPSDMHQEQREQNKLGIGVSVPDDNMSLDLPDAAHGECRSFSVVGQTEGKSPFWPVQVADDPAQVQESDVANLLGPSKSAMLTAVGGSSSASEKSVPPQKSLEGPVAVSVGAPSLPGAVTYPTVYEGTSDGNGVVEQSLLHELEDMGFNERTLNAELLRKNNYDMQKTVDELCGAMEWDPILVELQEMGFGDTDMNKRLLLKNAGSVKRVVLDLLSGDHSTPSMQPSTFKNKNWN